MKTQFIEKIFLLGKASQTLRFLLESLQPNLKLNLLYILYSSDPTPSKDDWRNISRPVKYEFDRGWHYKLILCMFLLLSLVALVQMGLTTWQSPPILSWNNGSVIAQALAIIIGCIYLFFIPFESFLYIAIPGIITIPVLTISELMTKTNKIETLSSTLILSPYFIWIPSILYFVNKFFLSFYSWKFSVSIYLFLFIACVLLWKLGTRLERAAKNPLQTIIELSENEIVENRFLDKAKIKSINLNTDIFS